MERNRKLECEYLMLQCEVKFYPLTRFNLHRRKKKSKKSRDKEDQPQEEPEEEIDDETSGFSLVLIDYRD